jgi:hypothetical protein
MAYRTRIKYTSAQKAEIWDRWQRHVSDEAIYRSLFIQARGVLKKELQQFAVIQTEIRDTVSYSRFVGALSVMQWGGASRSHR